MSEMIERVEAALERCREYEMPLRETARAVIEAMREPTESISKMSWCEGWSSELWSHMIDAALA